MLTYDKPDEVPASRLANELADRLNTEMYEPVVAAGKGVKPSETGALPVPAVAVQQWM